MVINRIYLWVTSLFKTLLVCFFIFTSAPLHAGYYSGHHYGHHSNYGVHGHISSDAGYVILGLLGVAVLSNIIGNNHHQHKPYRRTYSYNPPSNYKPPDRTTQAINYKKPASNLIYVYKENEGWDWLAKGNSGYALDIFAIQSQQNLNSGIPKVGFSIAAATNGDTDRAIRAMRKAVRIDATALDKVHIYKIKPTLEALSKNYKSLLDDNNNNVDIAFMLASLAYMQQNYAGAETIIAKNDLSQSAINLRELIKRFE